MEESLTVDPLFSGSLKKLLVHVPSSFCIMPSQGTSCSNIAPTPCQYCTFCGCQDLLSNTVGGDVWKWGVMRPSVPHLGLAEWLSWRSWGSLASRWLTGLPGALLLRPSRWDSWEPLGAVMEIIAVYCIPFIMSCLLACCFIATLLHSRTILVCKLYIFTLICHKCDIKINEFMFLIHQQELSPATNQDGTRILHNAN